MASHLGLSAMHRDQDPSLVRGPALTTFTDKSLPFPCPGSYANHTRSFPAMLSPTGIFLEKMRSKGSEYPADRPSESPSPLRPPASYLWKTSTHPSKPQLQCPLCSRVPLAAPSLAGGASLEFTQCVLIFFPTDSSPKMPRAQGKACEGGDQGALAQGVGL